MFSLAGHTIRKTRTRLQPETTRACICLKNWIKNDLGLSDNKDVGEINIDNDLVVEKDDIDCLIYLDE